MKKFTVHWSDRHKEKSTISANSEEEAAKFFLESQKEQRDQHIWVSSGLGLGPQTFLPESICLRKLGDHTPKAENVGGAVSGGASEEKAQQARHEISTRTQDSLDEHKHSLRQHTAYSGLRMYLSVTAWLTAIGFVILGLVLLSENNKGIGVSLLLFGPLVAALQYFIASVCFDIADAGLNTSMRIQDLHRMESSKETVSKSERS